MYNKRVWCIHARIQPRAGKPFHYHSVIIVHRHQHQTHPFHPQRTAPPRAEATVLSRCLSPPPHQNPIPRWRAIRITILARERSSGGGVRGGRTSERGRRVEEQDVSFCGKFRLYSAVSCSVSQNDYRVFN